MPGARTTSESTESTYLDFEVEIGPGQGREYPVSVLRAPSGEARGVLHFPYDELALESRLKDIQIALLLPAEPRRRLPTAEEQPVQRFGQDLFDALLAGEIRSAYDISWREAEAQGKGLRVKLRVQSPALAGLPWEFLYDAREGEYLCLMSDRPVMRYIEAAQPVQPVQITPPLRILGMIASPTGLRELNVEQEKLRLMKATERLQAQGLVEVKWLPGQTWRDLQRAMRSGPWHIFHFVGHGMFDRVRDEGVIAVADDAGESYSLTATDLSRLLADHKPLRLVLLNACESARGSSQDLFSSTASILVRRGIPAVVAMQYSITDCAAVEFARSFYESLADGLPADAAVSEARKAVSIAAAGSVEWATPVLFLHASDGRIFDLAALPPAAPEPAPPKPAPPEPEPQKPEPTQKEKPSEAPATQDRPATLPPATTGTPTEKAVRPKSKPKTTTKSPPEKSGAAVLSTADGSSKSGAPAAPAPKVPHEPTPQKLLSRLSLGLTVQPLSVAEGGAVTWTLTVVNSGEDDLHAVEVKIGTFSLGTLALAAGETQQMTGSATVEGANPIVLHFTAAGLNSLGQAVRAEVQQAITVRPRPKPPVTPPQPPVTPPKFTAPAPEALAALLQKFKRSGLDLAPNIPPAKLQKALNESQAPRGETALALIEGAYFGWYSCLVFGARGIYYCNPRNVLGGQPGPGAVPYADFPVCEFKADGWHMRVSLHAGKFLDVRQIAMAGISPDLVAEMLNGIKKLAPAR